MKKAKRIVAGFLALVLLMGMGVSEAGAEEPMIEKPYLGLDPSTVIDSEAEVPDIPDMEAYSGSSAVIQMEGSKKGIHGSRSIHTMEKLTCLILIIRKDLRRQYAP